MTNHVSIKPYQQILREFQGHIAKLFPHRYVLHGHEPRHNPMSWRISDTMSSESRGVSSDLLLIFEDRKRVTAEDEIGRFQRRALYDNIAFVFNRDAEQPDRLRVSFSRRTKGIIQASTEFSEETFQTLLKQVNRTFRNEGAPKTRAVLMDTLNVFMNNTEQGIKPYVLNVDISGLLGKYEPELLTITDDMHTDQAELDRLTEERDAILKSVDADMERSHEARAIRDLEQQLKAMKRAYQDKKDSLLAERGAAKNDPVISKKKASASRVQRRLRYLFSEIRMSVAGRCSSEERAAVEQFLRKRLMSNKD